MLLTLTEAAQYLGKSPRQVRYLVKAGQIKARKHEGRWVFDDAELPLPEAQRRGRERKAAELASVVEDTLRAQTRSPGKRGYSVVDLSAFRHGLAATRAAGERLGDHTAAVGALRQSLIALAQGCHRFHQRDKAEAFGVARERAAEAVALLHVDGTEVAIAIANLVEQDYLGALVGLLRREERRGRT
jgi:helix-turn-helix protein